MIEVIFLGTSCMQPTKERNHNGILIKYKDEHILMDCGEGIQRQMRFAGIKPAKITKLLISHWHGDHVLGIPGLMSAMGADQYAKKLDIYGPKGSKEYFKHMFKFFDAKSIIDYNVIEVEKGDFFENEDFILEAQPLEHSSKCIGFSFKEKDKRKIIISKMNKLGLREGPEIGKLQKGHKIVFNGKTILPDDLTRIVKGKKLSYVADTILCNGANILAENSDLLISEGTHLSNLGEKTEKIMHLTVRDAAMLAAKNNVHKLIITHISPRYKDSCEILEEAQECFNNVSVAEDFMKFKL
jgi:ribonuclease Z